MTTTAADVETFVRALREVEVSVHRCAGPAEAARCAAGLVGERPVVVDDDVAVPELVGGLNVTGDPWSAEFGITGVVAASARTGTLALAASAATPRSTSLLPPTHIALVPHHKVLPGLDEVIEVLAALRPAPSNMQLITGPSRSGDIEMKLVRGVHGPGTVHVVLFRDPGAG